MSKLYKSEAWLKLQRKRGKTIKEIADMCDVTYQMIFNQMQKWNIK